MIQEMILISLLIREFTKDWHMIHDPDPPHPTSSP